MSSMCHFGNCDFGDLIDNCTVVHDCSKIDINKFQLYLDEHGDDTCHVLDSNTCGKIFWSNEGQSLSRDF